jgi:arylsulfatase A-like enzyme
MGYIAPKINRRDFLKTAAVGAASLTAWKCGEFGRKAKRPNILFIMSDDHSANAIRCYGSHLAEFVNTSNLDRLAAEGARLQNCFCTNSICAPSRASILTGQYSHRNGVTTLHESLKPDYPNVAKEFQKNGYQTALFGKWHLKDDPAGFDDWRILNNQGRYYDPELKGPSSDYEVHRGYSTDVITDLSLEWLKNCDAESPFMLMCQFKAPHDRWHHADRFEELYREKRVPEPSNLCDDYRNRFSRAGKVWSTLERMVPDKYFPYLKPEALEGLDRNQIRKVVYQSFVSQYLRCAQAVDANLGRILDFLDKTGLAEDTIVVYTSDQGVFLGEHGYFDKRFMYEESLRMPFLVRWPKEISPGITANELVENVDFAPFFLDCAGIEVPSYMQGRSFLPILRGRTPEDWRRETYYRYWMHMSHFAIPAHYGIRTKKYKLIYYYGEPLGQADTKFVRRWVEGSPRIEPTEPEWELFDLEKDPREMHNRASDPEYAAVFSKLKQQLLEKKKAVGDTDDRFPELMAQREIYW